MFFDFQGQKVLLKAEFEGTPSLLAQAGSSFWIRALAASSLSTYGSTQTPNDKIMTVLVNICPIMAVLESTSFSRALFT